MVKISVIVDNNAAEGFIAEHGLSLWIEKGRNKILFDTGAGNALLPNAETLKINLNSLTHIVLSHGHFDHTGGLSLLPEDIRGPQTPVYTGEGITNLCYSLHPDGKKHPLTMSAKSREVLVGMQQHFVNALETPAEGIWLTGNIERNSGEDTGGSFFCDEECKKPNRIEEELTLLSEEGILVSGCSHSGIINIMEKFHNLLPDKRINTIIGGLHLIHAGGERLQKTVNYLNKQALKRVVLLHCTGMEAAKYLQRHLNCKVEIGYAGNILEF